MSSRAFPNFTKTHVNHGRLYLEELLGRGAFGAVYRGRDTKTSLHYAVKIMITPAFGSREEEQLHAEIEFHKRASKHDNVVTFHRHFVNGPFTFIVLDLCSGDNLFTRLQDDLYKFNDELIRSTMLQVIDALLFCHGADVYHRDLKPENILTSNDGSRVFLADFGLSTTDLFSDTYAGTPCYMSPECVASAYGTTFYRPRYNDIWSLGIILFNLVTGGYPWDIAQSTDEIFEEYLNDPDIIAEVTPIEMSSGCREIIQSILKVDPTQRLSLSEMRAAIEKLDTFFMEPGVERTD